MEFAFLCTALDIYVRTEQGHTCENMTSLLESGFERVSGSKYGRRQKAIRLLPSSIT